MGIVVLEVTFDGQAPTAARTASGVTEIIGLPVTVSESPPDVRGNLYALDARIAFERYPKAPVELTVYRPGAVREQLRHSGLDALPTVDGVQGANEAPGTQTVYVQGYVGQELTLLFATTLALETLGGRVRPPIPDEVRRECGRHISADELSRRRRKVQRQGLLALAAGVLLLPILIPLWVAAAMWHLVTFPHRLAKVYHPDLHRLPGGPPGDRNSTSSGPTP